MQAVILAAGKGTRMRPLTDEVPKPMLKMGKGTILDHTIEQLPDAVTELVIVVGYLQGKIRQHIAEKYPDKKITFVEENEAKGTGYALSVCKKHLDGHFLVINGDDLYHKKDLEILAKEQWAVLAQQRNDTERFGIVETDADGNFSGIAPGAKGKSGLVMIGAYMVGQEYFDFPLEKTSAGEYGLPHTLLGMAKKGRKIKVLHADYWEPIGFPQDLMDAQLKLNS